MIAGIIDLVGSKALTLEDRQKLNDELRAVLKGIYERYKEFCIARPSLTQGDSIELLVNHWKPIAFLSHKLLIKQLDFSVGFGTGEVHILREFADECDGPAFWNARAALENVKKTKAKRLIVDFVIDEGSKKEEIEIVLNAALFLITLKNFTTVQLEYSYYYIWEGKNVSEIAVITSTSKGNVSKVLSRSNAYTLKRLISFDLSD